MRLALSFCSWALGICPVEVCWPSLQNIFQVTKGVPNTLSGAEEGLSALRKHLICDWLCDWLLSVTVVPGLNVS